MRQARPGECESQVRVRYQEGLVEAPGIEPLLPLNPNPMMANDIGFYDMKTFGLPRRIESPGVLPSLGDIMETLQVHHREQLIS